jgi:hypothetical protein
MVNPLKARLAAGKVIAGIWLIGRAAKDGLDMLGEFTR